MTALCVGALLAGLIAASAIPFLPFACALSTAIVVGAAWAVLRGAALGRTALSAFVLLSACQIGYGLGLGALALLGHRGLRRRPVGESRDPASVRQIRSGNGSR